jgi:4'-phosphopantetheinyl transferase EntD
MAGSAAAFDPLVEAGVSVAEASASRVEPEQLPLCEIEAIEGAVAKRRQEFAAGRECARAALFSLGHPPGCALPVGPGGAPVWPAGFAGSISHAEGRCVAAVAPTSIFRSIGVDIEADRPLPPEVVPLVVAPAELRDLPTGHNWETVIFSAKEAVFKAWFPLTGRWLGFEEARVRLDVRRQRFWAEPRPTEKQETFPEVIEGRFAAAGSMIFTAVCVRREAIRGGRS